VPIMRARSSTPPIVPPIMAPRMMGLRDACCSEGGDTRTYDELVVSNVTGCVGSVRAGVGSTVLRFGITGLFWARRLLSPFSMVAGSAV